jgi:hypothetical protein
MSIQLAKQYYEYMNFRANEENLKHELSIEFYQVGLNEGCPFFFGVYHNGKNIVEDIENKDVFNKWKQLKLNKKLNNLSFNLLFN